MCGKCGGSHAVHQGVASRRKANAAPEQLGRIRLREWALSLRGELSGGSEIAIFTLFCPGSYYCLAIILADEPTRVRSTSKTSTLRGDERYFKSAQRLRRNDSLLNAAHDPSVGAQTNRILHIRRTYHTR